jgi:hypothetical protein
MRDLKRESRKQVPVIVRNSLTAVRLVSGLVTSCLPLNYVTVACIFKQSQPIHLLEVLSFFQYLIPYAIHIWSSIHTPYTLNGLA